MKKSEIEDLTNANKAIKAAYELLKKARPCSKIIDMWEMAHFQGLMEEAIIKIAYGNEIAYWHYERRGDEIKTYISTHA